ncbi:beta-ketoacyl-ACP synthase III [Criblamydia sequanensis]|uniref:Beta-ketoacyl-[acyl-carrier-protein] synthase III n=1 Tax=Candidatus Criblamydia sequanensis CRIB-18 TaxID=1437425 RepID=A0A090CYU2_9BACT|nr:beta-ketoacyl-ACP synthase III [Criblamydia sequanensis]CDR33902.1 3-oxoacyl-[acyl-carrier-protein] synthase 3 [Criblamydia sequanensis CRIB-18]
MNNQQATIKYISSFLPERILTNHELVETVATSDDWIQQRTGIKERRIAENSQASSDLGIAACKKLLHENNLAPSDIDLIIVATMSPDFIAPSTASIIQHGIGAVNAASLDVGAACAGYIYGLSTAKAYIEANLAKRVLFVAAEKMSSLVNYKDRATCILFGDGASAALIEKGGEGLAIGQIVLGSDGSQSHLIKIPAGGSREPATKETVLADKHFLSMEGPEVFKQAIRKMGSSLETCLSLAKVKLDDITYFIPHQANIRIIDALAKQFGLSDEKVWKTVDKHGNTSAASIGLALDDLLSIHPLERGDLIALTGIGSGLSFGSIILKKI